MSESRCDGRSRRRKSSVSEPKALRAFIREVRQYLPRARSEHFLPLAALGAETLLSAKEGLNVMPASTAGLISLVDFHRRTPLPGDRGVVILTGRRP